MSDPVSADPFEDGAVTTEMQRPVTHVMIRGLVDDAGVSEAGSTLVHPQLASVWHFPAFQVIRS